MKTAPTDAPNFLKQIIEKDLDLMYYLKLSRLKMKMEYYYYY